MDPAAAGVDPPNTEPAVDPEAGADWGVAPNMDAEPTGFVPPNTDPAAVEVPPNIEPDEAG